MSRERELLLKWIRRYVAREGLNDSYREPISLDDVYGETLSLLAQPEQEHVGIVRTIGGYPDQSEHTVVLTCRHGDLKDGDLLYKAPQKREPLSDDAVARLILSVAGDKYSPPSPFELVRATEKHYKIGGGE